MADNRDAALWRDAAGWWVGDWHMHVGPFGKITAAIRWARRHGWRDLTPRDRAPDCRPG